MSFSDYIPSKTALVTLVLGAALGALPSWFISAHYASDAEEKRIAAAIENASAAAAANAREIALKDFESTAPDRLMEMFPSVFEQVERNARDAGFLEGRNEVVVTQNEQIREEGKREGFEEGYKKGKLEGEEIGFSNGRQAGYDSGYSTGFDEGQLNGRNQQIALEGRFEAAQRNWANYERLVAELGEAARRLEQDPNNEELLTAFTSLAIAVARVSEDLQDAHSDQSAAFNSIMTELRRAVEVRNLPRMRETSRAIQDTLETKRELFLEGTRNALETFGELAQ